MSKINTTGKILNAAKLFCFIAALSTLAFSTVVAQTGALYGGRIRLTNGTNSISLKDTSVMTGNYTLTLPGAQSSASTVQWFSLGQGSSQLGWTSNPNGVTGSAINFAVTQPQQYASTSNYLFNLECYTSTNPSSALNVYNPGARINSTVTGNSDNATGLTINVANTSSSATGISELGAEFQATAATTTTGSVSVNVGLSANASGNGSNYAALFKHGSVGIGTTAPLDLLDVNGNIKMDLGDGLRITEGSNATMGTATLSGGTVTVSTSKVTGNSRIFLTDETPGGSTTGTPYVSTRTAGTSFTISSTNASDTSHVAWWIVEPAADNLYTSSSTWTVPTGVTSIRVSGTGGSGGGGGGGGASNGAASSGGGGGGGAGEYFSQTVLSVVSGETLTITVGSAGTAGTAGTSSGTNGGTGGNGGSTTIVGSTSGTIFSANGGSGGTGGTGTTSGTLGSGGSGGNGGVVAGSTPSGGTAGSNGSTGGAGTGGPGAAGGTGGAGGTGPSAGGQTFSGGTGGAGIKPGAGGSPGSAGSAGASGFVEISY